jgi:asparagine synthase (glutamine-hydrolysing)
MCGIAGVLGISSTAVQPTALELRAMVGTLHHRGPDGQGIYCENQIGLAHARLSIIDLAGGEQPIHNEDRSVWVVFNGEVFNFIELRVQLEAQGHQFYTHSDTEVIVHLYEQYGDDFVLHLNGQFAIALWDKTRERLVLARDRTGIRPLFYTHSGGRFLFASEVKALFAVSGVERRIDALALHEIFTFWAPLHTRSVFSGVQSLPPGHVMVLERDKQTVRCYWDWSFEAHPVSDTRSAQSLADELRELMVDAVRLQLRADVPVGAYLSGGLDSAIITSLIHHFTDTPLRTFSLTFEDDEFDESAQQLELSRYFGCPHTAVRCTRADIAAHFPRTLWHTESPVVRTAPTPLMLLSNLVREQGVKVVLTGEGADEVFGGYDIFKEAKVRRFMARAPQSGWRASLLSRLYPYLKHSPASSGAFARQFFQEGMAHLHAPYFAHIPRWNTTGRIAQYFSPALREAGQGWSAYAAMQATLPQGMQRWSPLAQDQYVEAHTLLSGYLLSSQGDRMAMASSIEGRMPFLDHRVIEFANRLPSRYKLMGLTEKYLLKKSVQGLLPDSIRTRTKQPYRAPDCSSFFVDGKPVEYVAELLSAPRIAAAGYFNAQAVSKLFEKCRSGRAIGFGDNMAFVGILSTMWVDALFVRGDVVAPEI